MGQKHSQDHDNRSAHRACQRVAERPTRRLGTLLTVTRSRGGWNLGLCEQFIRASIFRARRRPRWVPDADRAGHLRDGNGSARVSRVARGRLPPPAQPERAASGRTIASENGSRNAAHTTVAAAFSSNRCRADSGGPRRNQGRVISPMGTRMLSAFTAGGV